MAQAPVPAPAQEQEAAPKGGASEVISNVHSGLMELMSIFDGAPSIGPEDKKALGAVISQFQGLIEGLSAGPGAAPAAPKGGMGAVPMESGMAKASPVIG